MTPSGQHPLPYATGAEPWRVHPHNPRAGGPTGRLALWGWRLEDGAVVLQSDDGDVTVSADCLASVANGLLAVHVHNGRPDFRPAAVASQENNIERINEMPDGEKQPVDYKAVKKDLEDRQSAEGGGNQGQSDGKPTGK